VEIVGNKVDSSDQLTESRVMCFVSKRNNKKLCGLCLLLSIFNSFINITEKVCVLFNDVKDEGWKSIEPRAFIKS